MNYVLDAILAITAVWAVITDLKQRRISNRATFGAALAALVVRSAMGGGMDLL